MDIKRVIAGLRSQLSDLSQAILALEQLSLSQSRQPRGRPRKTYHAKAISINDGRHLAMAAGWSSGVENKDGTDLHRKVSKSEN